MRIVNNLMAMNAHRQLTVNQGGIQKSIEKLSSGLRINRAGDDAAGLAISEKMRGQIRGLNQAVRNAQDGISLIQTAEGALQETHAILQRMRELAVQAANDTYTLADRKEIQKEINELISEIDRIADTTEFNTQNLLGGVAESNGDEDNNGNGAVVAATFTFHIGANAGQQITLSINPMNTGTVETNGSNGSTGGLAIKHLEVGEIESITEEPDADSATVGVLTQAGADGAITAINDAIEKVSAERSKLGAYQNRLEHTIANLGVSAENLQAAESRIRDVDMAAEMMQFTKYQILQQASTAMLAQANLAPQSVLQLLG